MNPTQVWPWGPMAVLTPTYANPLTIAIANQKTEVSVTLTGDIAITISTDSEVRKGAKAQLRITSDTHTGGRAVTGDGTTLICKALTTAATPKVTIAEIEYGSDGVWRQTSDWVQIN